MFAQFVELQRKQVKEWNQHRKEKMDVPPALKERVDLKTNSPV